MTDVFSKEKRAQVMAAVRSKGNKATELKLVGIFRAFNIVGWRRQSRLTGSPDFVFRKDRLAVFVDGCFWHGCHWHLRMPKENRAYWRRKIVGNMARDKRATQSLKAAGWRVLRIWEHSLRKPEKVAQRVISQLRILRSMCQNIPGSRFKRLRT